MSPPVTCAVRDCDNDSTHRVLVADEPFYQTDEEALLVCTECAEVINMGGASAEPFDVESLS